MVSNIGDSLGYDSVAGIDRVYKMRGEMWAFATSDCGYMTTIDGAIST